MAKQFNRRKRNYLINKDLQGKLGLQYLLLTIAGIFLLGLLFAAASSDHLTISYDNNAIEVGSAPQVLLGELLRSEGVFLLIGGVLIILITIFLTHKIAGPLYRFEQTLEAMCNRRLDQKIYLRKGDEGKKLGTLINDFNQKLTTDLELIRSAAVQLDSSSQKQQILEVVERYEKKPDTH